jgi:hypothetical protein
MAYDALCAAPMTPEKCGPLIGFAEGYSNGWLAFVHVLFTTMVYSAGPTGMAVIVSAAGISSFEQPASPNIITEPNAVRRHTLVLPIVILPGLAVVIDQPAVRLGFERQQPLAHQ